MENENHKRKYYTGFCGHINIVENNELSLFVNLRSMEIYKNSFVLYLGGGIIKGSNPDSEWQETENKALTLSKMLQ
ncbi:MAG: chorismate-binding protein [Saprospiraceae bacterium]